MIRDTGKRKSTRIARNDTSIYKEGSDSDSSEVENDASDEEYMAPSDTSKKRNKSTKNVSKRSKHNGERVTKSVDELGPDFTENRLYKALSQPDLSIHELALEWIEEYLEQSKDDSDSKAVAELVNLLLRSCGCIYLLQPHDLVNLESAADTVGELTIAFEKQQFHEYPFISNNKSLKFFRKNVCEFFENVVYLAHEKGLLYLDASSENDDHEEREESSLFAPLMNKVLTWLSSLSSCTVRPLRYISTIILLTIQTKLCDIIVTVTTTLEKHQRQLSNNNTNTKSKSNKKTRNNKVDTITKNIQTSHNQKETIYEYFTDITETTFIHRYRDIDPQIRQECLRHLGQWMIIYPEFFFQSSYLRYYGWLLSDPSNHVRAEVTRVLLKLYKSASSGNQNMSIGFRQFTERFKKQLIKMSKRDNDFNVKFNLLSICCELLKIGFLEDKDNLEIAQNIFYLLEYGSGLGATYNEKLKTELGRFISLVNLESTKCELEKYSIFIENYESPQFGAEAGKLDINDCLRTKNLIVLLQNAYDVYLLDKKESNLEKSRTENFAPITEVFKILYNLPSYENSWEFLVRYLLFDLSSIVFNPKSEELETDSVEVTGFKKLLDLSSENDQFYLLNFISGSIISIFTNQRKRNKETEKEDDNPSSVLIKLINYLPSVQKHSIKSDASFSVFLQLWNVLVGTYPNHDNIYTIFQNMGQINVFNNITGKIIKFYQMYDVADFENDQFLQLFDDYFSKLLASYDNYASIINATETTNSSANIMNNDIRLKVQNLLQELIAEAKEALSLNPSGIEFQRGEFHNDELENQKSIFDTLIALAKPLIKLGKLGNHINIDEYINDSSSKSSIIELIMARIFNKIDVELMVNKWPNIFIQKMDNFIQSYKTVLDLILIWNSWNLEELIFTPSSKNNPQHHYDIELIFEDLHNIITQNLRVFHSLSDSMNHMYEISGSSSSNVTLENSQLMIDRLNTLKTLVGVKFIDIVVSMKVFYIKFNNKNSFKNFDNFFNGPMGGFIRKPIPTKVQTQLLDIFLYNEAKLAILIDVELDRMDEEDANFGEFIGINNDHKQIDRSGFDSDSEDDNLSDSSTDDAERSDKTNTESKNSQLKQKQKKERDIWLAEKDLCVFTIKLFTLIHASMVNDFIFDRLKLNSEKIGGLYYKILKSNEEQLKISGNGEKSDAHKDISMSVEKENTPSTAFTNMSDNDFQIQMDDSIEDQPESP